MRHLKILTFATALLSFAEISFAVENASATLHPLSQAGRISLTPAFTPDGSTAYFPLSPCGMIGECPQIMHVARRKNGIWSEPKNLGLSNDGYNDLKARVDWPSVAPDGKTLLFSWSRDRPEKAGQGVLEDFDLWALDLTDEAAKPLPLDGENLNLVRGGKLATIEYFYNETAPRLTETGELYFWTQREDGMGGRDIYSAQQKQNGTYAAPSLLAAPINTGGDDQIDWISEDGLTMLLTREGDIFRSQKVEGLWTKPIELGPEVNSPYPDFGATVTPDGKTLVFSSTRPSANGMAGLIQIWQTPYNN